MGEGSFAGRYSSLPDLEDAKKEDKSTLSLRSYIPHLSKGKREVFVDVEPIEEEKYVIQAPSPPLDFSLTNSSALPHTLLEESQRLSVPTLPDDAVVLNDGKNNIRYIRYIYGDFMRSTFF